MGSPGMRFGCLAFVLLMAFMLLCSGIKFLPQHERGVIFRLGRLMGARGPGLFFVIPIIEKMVRVDLRTQLLELPVQDVTSRDQLTVRIEALLACNVLDPTRAVVLSSDYRRATLRIAGEMLRRVVEQLDFNQLEPRRELLGEPLQQAIDEESMRWGITVTHFEIKKITLLSTGFARNVGQP